ncbi:glycosyltransferase family 4 protein [Cyanobium sp. To12R1]|uniref:glycosyltransferase family 4 protein n=1 Tax=Cyanobium sp. To12R1 TaxID=2823723 RepID=UPI0037BE8430
MSGTRLLYRAEATDHALGRGHVRRVVRDKALRWLYRRIDERLYIGEHARCHFARLGSPAAHFSPYCVDVGPFDPDDDARERLRSATRESLGIGPERRVILYSGKLVHRKGMDVLLDAAVQVRPYMPDLTLLIVGDGQMRASMEGVAEGAGLDVRFAGFQPQQALSSFYHASDVFVLPSRASETWGLVVNEALHHGLPCLVTDNVGSAPDLVIPGETGEVVEAGRADALADGLARLLSWWHEGASGRARRRAQVKPYSVDAAARGIVQAYEAAQRA